MSGSAQLSRNAGPSWGFTFLTRAQRVVPRWLLWPGLAIGTWIAVARMPAQRAHSRAFLTLIRGRPAGLLDVWRHFFSFLQFLLLRLRIASGTDARCALDPENAADFNALIASGEPAFFGTFHFGHSDLLGFLLPGGRRVAMIRMRMANSTDTRMFAEQFAGAVSFIWVNEPQNLLFALKSAVDAGDSIAMQCDRVEFTAKTEVFDFLGARRVFPFTIYHLAILFGKPVMFCIGRPDGADGTRIVASPLFRPDPALPRAANLARAHEHFQRVLGQLESLVRQHPLLWFNFHPLNPVAPSEAAGLPDTSATPAGRI
jgi:predicted LPLAT superfamily acyltransferase